MWVITAKSILCTDMTSLCTKFSQIELLFAHTWSKIKYFNKQKF